MNHDPYAATHALFSELVAQGVDHVLVSPGSRSTPLALTALRTEGLDVAVHLDERSAGFWALGRARATRRPVALVCTSGTAAANYLPAVIEAHYSPTPLIVITADRPPELRDRGAGQTIEQPGIYGRHVRWWADLPVAGEADPAWFAATAARAVRAATGPSPGPVHLNWPFREPLEPTVATAPGRTTAIRLQTSVPSAASPLIDEVAELERGLVVAGPMTDDHFETVSAFCRVTGWPLLAEPLSQLRQPGDGMVTTAHHDHLLRTPWADQMVPDVVIRVGGPMTCKPLRLWLERHRPRHVLIDPAVDWTDASTTVTDVISGTPELLGRTIRGNGASDWAQAWAAADRAAVSVADAILDSEELLEAGIARGLGRWLPSGSAAYVSNSMPVRDVDTFVRPRSGLRWFGNRGASGIDGVVSSAGGVASTGAPTTLYIGDLALLHDIGGLLAAVHHGVDMNIVVASNGGGSIFSFLPVAAHHPDAGGPSDEEFRTLFTTPHSRPLVEVAGGCGAGHLICATETDLAAALADHPNGVRILEVPVDADRNLQQHRRIAAAISDALR